MKILFIGLGSAGQRHLRNLKKILGEKAEFSAYRVRKLDRVFDDKLNIVQGETLAETYSLKEYDNLDLALSNKPNIVFISNPNSMHMECALKAAKAGCDLFIEKPLSDSMEYIDELTEITKKQNLIVYVGYQMRLHPCVRKLKEIVKQKIIGDTLSVQCEIGELLTKMHMYEDYRGMNESQKKNGGGVVICQIHELDYLYWIFGMPESVYSVGGKCSDLEIDVEDNVSTVCMYREGERTFPVSIHQDFLQYPPTRMCKVVGTKGWIQIDILKNSYCIYKNDGSVIQEQFDNYQRNEMFMEEAKLFLKYVKERKQNSLTIEEGVGSLKIALAIKESMGREELIKLDK